MQTVPANYGPGGAKKNPERAGTKKIGQKAIGNSVWPSLGGNEPKRYFRVRKVFSRTRDKEKKVFDIAVGYT